VCREHFTPTDFEGPATLRADAVPSLFSTYSRSLMDKQNASPTKRFRSDMANIRAKQTAATINNNKRTQLPYRNSNYYPKQQQQDQILSPSPTRESLEENIKQIINDTKQITDIDLNMNCFDEQLSDAQIAHCPVKVCLIDIVYSELFISAQNNPSVASVD
jgi:hypothetical protein